MSAWLQALPGQLNVDWGTLLLWLLLFVVASLVTLALFGGLLLLLPADYFCDARRRGFWRGRHPLLRAAGWLLQNLLGLLALVAGLTLSLPGVPGPGALLIVIGLLLLEFPGKRRLEFWLLRRRQLWQAANRLRERCGRPPFVLNLENAGEQRPTDGA